MAKLNKHNKGATSIESSRASSLQLAVINQHTAGIDIGTTLMMVSYTDTQGNQCLFETDGFTQSLHALAQKLVDASVTDEATGIYWMSLYEILEEYGLVVTLINPRHFKNVHAQKTDAKDCQWINQLHAHGLLRASHIAPELYRELRSYLHERNRSQSQKGDTLNCIQRTLSLMNLKVQHLLSDIEGVSGMAVLEAIAGGCKEPEALVELIKLGRVKASKEDLILSLSGYYKANYIAILNQQLKTYKFHVEQMRDYEKYIEAVLKKMLPEDEKGTQASIPDKKTKIRKNQYAFNLSGYLKEILNVDTTEIPGFNEITTLSIIAVTGNDMSKWKKAKYFTSWLNLSPIPSKSGGKLLGHLKRYTNNPASQAFRLAAQSLWNHKGSLGVLYRRLSAQRGSSVAIKAVARKLAIIFYNMVKYGKAFDSSKITADPTKQRDKKVANLKKQLAAYGYAIQPIVNTSL